MSRWDFDKGDKERMDIEKIQYDEEASNRQKAYKKWYDMEENLREMSNLVIKKCGYCFNYNMDCWRCPLSETHGKPTCDARAMSNTTVGAIQRDFKALLSKCRKMMYEIKEDMRVRGEDPNHYPNK